MRKAKKRKLEEILGERATKKILMNGYVYLLVEEEPRAPKLPDACFMGKQYWALVACWKDLGHEQI